MGMASWASRVLVCLVVVGSLVACGSSEKHTLLGEVLIMQDLGVNYTSDTSCDALGHPAQIAGGETVYITLANGDELTTDLSPGRVTDEGNCSFEFVVDVPDSDRYAFTVNGVTELREKQTIGTSIPAGLGHSREADGDWWVTLSLSS